MIRESLAIEMQPVCVAGTLLGSEKILRQRLGRQERPLIDRNGSGG